MNAHQCEAEGCTNPVPAGRRCYCSDRCAARQRKRRERDCSRVEVTVDVSLAFGVECDPLIAWIFSDDRERFARMGLTRKGLANRDTARLN